MISISITSIPSVLAANASNKIPFDDITNSYAQKEIIRLASLNILNGTGPRTFSPQKPVTRAEFTVMINRLLRLEAVDSAIAAFTDVRKNDWYYGWIQAGLNLGIVDGVRPGIFEPQKQISRQEVAALIVRATKMKAGSTSSSLPFVDSNKVASWAIPYVYTIHKNSIMSGEGNKFRPNDAMTRQETAVVLARILDSPFGVKVSKGQQTSVIQMGWQYDSTTTQFINQIESSNINTLVPRWFYLENNGVVSDNSNKELMTYASKHNKKIWAMLGNRSNSELTHTILSSSITRNKVIQQLTSYVKKYKLAGINVDFESVDPIDRDNLTAFISALSNELHKIGAVTSIDVSPDLGTDWTDGFDYAKLGKSADYVVLMSYDEHWSTSPKAGSVSSLPWVEKALNKLILSVPAKKVIVALPFYTRDWSYTSKGVVSDELSLLLQNQRISAMNAKLSWNNTTGQYVATYSKQGTKHSIWAEDSRSLSIKAHMAAKKGIAGYGYWYMGAESRDIWAALRNVVKYSAY
ncbi:glycoside hydrolase [Paenibacillus glacialis]|uniref:Glycoside hydrolase n=1 Tax=Paenibacillus glacialis TaxID=494026 RepID=A0A168K4J0_9BACL|nr:glycoside hydrolase [Paenibacillus glacialis]